MINRITIVSFFSLLILTGCGTTCVEKVAASKATLGQVVAQANIAYEGNIIDLETYEQVDAITDQANIAISEALPVCITDESKALATLRQARIALLKSQELMKNEE